MAGEEGDAYEERDQDDTEPRQHDACVLRLGRLERGHPVRDRLHSGERRAARGESAEDEEQRQVLSGRDGRASRERRRVPAEGPANEPIDDQDAEAEDEQVGRQCEELAGLADAPEVAERDEGDERDPEDDPVRVERRDGGRERRHPRRHADGDGQHVVDQQRSARDQPRQRAEVVLGDDVGTAALRVGEDGLPVGARHHGDQDGDGDADGDRVVESRGAGEDKNEQDLLGRVCDGGECVGREDRERRGLGEPLVAGLRRCEGTPDQELLERVEVHRGVLEGPTLAAPAASVKLQEPAQALR